MFDERVIRVNGVALNLAQGGTGVPVLLVHGVLRGWRDFAPLWPMLLPSWQVNAVDLRGHGRSERRPGRYRVVDYAEDVIALVREQMPKGVLVYGHSLGALIAVAVAAAVPDRVRGIVLEDPPAPSFLGNVQDSPYHALWTGMHELVRTGPREVGPLARALAELPVPAGEGLRLRLGDLRDATALRFGARCLLDVDADVLPPLLAGRWLDGTDVEGVWSAVRCPALLLRGDPALGGMLGRSEAEGLVGLMADGTLIDIKGAGHLLHWMAAETTARLVLGFFESLL